MTESEQLADMEAEMDRLKAEEDPFDPDAHQFTDIAEGTTDGDPVDSQYGSELVDGGEDQDQ